MISLRSKSVMVVARMRIRLTVPDRLPMVTTSPIRTGRSKDDQAGDEVGEDRLQAEAEAYRSAATSHCSLSQLTPRVDRALTMPMPLMA